VEDDGVNPAVTTERRLTTDSVENSESQRQQVFVERESDQKITPRFADRAPLTPMR
jgi:hypothetical protein